MVKRDEISAVRTRRTGRDRRLAARQPVDAHVQEAAKAQPQREGRGFKKEFHVG